MNAQVGKLSALVTMAGMLAGCFVRISSSGEVDGAEVERTIDVRISPQLRAGLPGINVAPSHCPVRINVSLHKRVSCVIPIDGDEIPVAVRGSDTMPFEVGLQGTVFELRRIATITSNDIAAEYGVRMRVDCGRGVRLLDVGMHVRCAVPGTQGGHADVEIRGPNRIIVHALAGMGRRHLADGLAAYLVTHKAHHRTVVPGAVISPYIALQIRNQFGGKPTWLRPFRGVRCPSEADMTGSRRMICRLQYGDVSPRYAAWIDDAEGIRMDPLDAMLLTDLVRAYLLASLKARMTAAGRNEPTAVDCGRDRFLIVQPGSTFHCRAYAGREQADVTITVLDADGRFHFDLAPLLQAA